MNPASGSHHEGMHEQRIVMRSYTVDDMVTVITSNKVETASGWIFSASFAPAQLAWFVQYVGKQATVHFWRWEEDGKTVNDCVNITPVSVAGDEPKYVQGDF